MIRPYNGTFHISSPFGRFQHHKTTVAAIPGRRTRNIYPKTHKKSAGIRTHRSSRVSGLRNAFLLRISNAEAHAVCILNGLFGNPYVETFRETSLQVIYKTMGIDHCLTVQQGIEFAKFDTPQIRR